MRICLNCHYTLDKDTETCPSCGYDNEETIINICDNCKARADCSLKADYKIMVSCRDYEQDNTAH